MSKLDDIFKDLWTVYYNKGLSDDYYIAQDTAKHEIKDLMLELADQVELETNFTTGIPDAIALLRRKVNAL